MQLPRNYNCTLQKTYKDCRVRWSAVKEEWQLERRANYQRLNIDPAKYPREATDTFIRHKDGYYLAGSFAPNALPSADRLVSFLKVHDPVQLGYGPDSGDKLAIDIEAREAQREAEKYAGTKREFVESGADVLHDAAKIKSFVPRYEFGATTPRAAAIERMRD